jgi:hypothetical protein
LLRSICCILWRIVTMSDFLISNADFHEDDASDCPSEDEEDAHSCGLGDGAAINPPHQESVGDIECDGTAAGAENQASTAFGGNSADSVLPVATEPKNAERNAETNALATEKLPQLTKSIAHDDLNNGAAIYISLDLETGGPDCGIIQLSAVVSTLKGEVIGEFNSYVRPRPNAKWNQAAMDVTGLGPSNPSITSASGIEEVWPKFYETINRWTENGAKKGILVAWQGSSCDIQWLYNVTEVTHQGTLFMPKGFVYFLDPCFIIGHYKFCLLNEKK